MTEERLSGEIHSVIYNNEDTGYAVIRIASDDGSLETAVGTLPFASPGERLDASGLWAEHPSHGRQFVFAAAERSMPQTEHAILEYLASGVVPGVGRATARLIVERFGNDTLKIMETHPEKLSGVRGITVKRAASIGCLFSEKIGQRRLMELVAAFDVPPGFALELYKMYGGAAETVLRENPYLLLDEPFCVSFASADKMATAFGIEEDNGHRLRAGLLYVLNIRQGEGHSYLPVQVLINASAALLQLGEMSLVSALSELEEEGALVRSGEEKIYLPRLFEAERDVARFVTARAGKTAAPPSDLMAILSRIEKEVGICYADAQKKAIASAAEYPMMILTGGPGTGKTTTIRGMLRLFDWMGLRVLLCAPTGRAAKRLTELTGREASTIHRLLEFGYDPATGSLRFLRDADNPLDCEVVILDECSMVDILLMKSLVDALSEDCRLVISGDPDQLPAVGAGNVLEDLLQCDEVPAVGLFEIFRQAAESRIVTYAHAVNHGRLPDLRNDRQGDFFFMRRDSYESAAETIIELCKERLPKGLGIDSAQIQVLSPTRKGPCGTVSLNKILQEALNPPAPHKLEKRWGEHICREGDRVMQIRNNYNLIWRQIDGAQVGMGIFNGEIGIVREIDLSGSRMTVQFDNRLAEYGFDELSELEPAFAMTVHKAQGSEYGAVVLAVMPGSEKLMSRRVLYTAITRARDWLVLVGREDVVRYMAENESRTLRYSGLAERLRD